MTMCDQLLQVSDAYATALGIGRKRASTIIMNRGSKLDDIAAGGDLGTRIFERAMQFLSDTWPEGADWPEGIARPEPQIQREAAE